MKAFPQQSEAATLVELLRDRALGDPARQAYTFLTDGDLHEVHLTCAQLDQRARAIAASLQAAGAKGERVLLLYPPGLEYIAAFFGCLYAGAVAVPVYPPRMNQNLVRLESIIEDSQPALTLTTSLSLSRSSNQFDKTSTLQKLRYLATDTLDDKLAGQWQDPNVTAEHLAFLQYTSGSTSEPKGVMVSHANLLANAQMMRQACSHPDDAVFVNWLPLYHDMGLIGNVLQSLFFGATCVIMSPASFLQQPFRWLNAISRYRAHTSGGPNFAYDLCVRRISAAERATLDLSSWKVAFNGAEPVSRDTLDRFAKTFATCGFRREAFYPCYGLAEATLFVSGSSKESAPAIKAVRSDALKQNRVITQPDGDANSQVLVSCGQTLPQNKIVITNPETLLPCPPDEVGEIWLSGPSVARGYWNRPEENELCFNAYHAGVGDGPYLRTGDLGFLDGGELFIAGRLKDLIIIRGLNHYPQDIEQTVQRCSPALRPGCGAAFSINVAGEERVVLVNEVTPRHKDFDLPAIVESIREAVALEHDLQVYSVVLIAAGSIPKTSSGKIRRRACREAFINGSLEVLESDTLAEADAQVAIALSKAVVIATPPEERQELVESYLEHCVRRLFRLGASQPVRHQSLWKLGLDSLVAFELSTEIATNLGVEIAPAELLGGPSIVDLAGQILQRLHTKTAEDGITPGVATTPLEPTQRNHGSPLSSTQLRLWFLSQLVQGSPLYNIPVALSVSGGLDHEALELSLNTVIGRHESLRTTFRVVSGQPLQVIAPALTLRLEVAEAGGSSSSDRAAQVQRLVNQEARRPFDLAAGPLIRGTLFRLDQHEHVLLIVLHHIIADGWSVGVLIREMLELYEAYSEGKPIALPELNIQYADFAVWEQTRLKSAEMNKHLAYWKQQLGEQLPLLRLPSERPRPAELSYQGSRESFRIDQDIVEKLRQVGEREQTTLFMIMLAALNVLLYRYTGQHDIVVGTPIANRNTRETGSLIGCFVNTLAIRTAIDGDETFRDFLGVVRRVLLDAYLHQDVPFEKVVEELQPHRSLSHAPLFQVMLAYQSYANIATKVGELTLSRMEVDTGTAQFDLLLFLDEDEHGLSGSFEYSSDLFDEATVTRMVDHFTMLLRSLANNPDEIVSAVPLLTEAEHHQLVIEWNRTTTAFPTGKRVHDLFELQVRQTPDAVAVITDSERLTYRELNERANQLAARLRRLGVRPDVLVGLCVDRSSAMVVGMLGILKAGGAYLPLDPAYPKERLAFMLEDGAVPVLVTQQALLRNLPETQAQVVILDQAVTDLIEESGEDLSVEADASNLAYVIYTSGSTGKPKGVAIQHNSVVTFIYWSKSVFSPEELSGVLASTSICFDISVFEIFVPLSCGGKIVLAENALELPGSHASAEIKLINTVPSAMGELLKMKAVPPSVRTVNLAGEALRSTLSQQVLSETSADKLYNLYGPSEDTTYSTFARIDQNPDYRTTIGRPIANTEAYIVDQNLNPLPIGVTGELYLSGEGLARGYLNRPDVTATRFIPNPFSVVPGRRLYKTGDLARYLPNGEIDFLGRGDSQIKIRGFRIELGEIQSVLLAHPAVQEAVVMVYGEDSDKRLAAYLVGKPQQAVPGTSELRRFLSEKLPAYMVPSVFVALDKMPLTPNGKTDRKALPPPERAGATGPHEFVGPRNKTEEIVASIWSGLLGIEKISVFDNFFELGGHSLLATGFVARVRECFQVELSLRSVFLFPTVAGVAQKIDDLRGEPSGRHIPAIQRIEHTQPLPLSFAQQRLWLLNQIDTSSAFYNISGGLRLKGSLNFRALQQSLREITRRHEILRIRFASIDDQPRQLISPEILLSVPIVDLQHLPELECDAEISRLMQQEAQLPFDLEKPPLLRVSLIRISAQEHVLLLTAHHIVFDGWSIEVFIKELVSLFAAFSTGKPSPLAELPIQYGDYAAWQREWLTGETLETQLSFWKKQLAGKLPLLDLPADRPRPPVQTFKGAKWRFVLSEELTGSLKSLGKQNGATLFSTLLAALNVLLYRYSGQTDILIGSPIANRSLLNTEDLIGCFVNTIVIRTDLSGQPSFEELLRRVSDTALGAYANQDMPFERLVEELQPDRDLSRTPLFQVMLSVRKDVSAALNLPGLSLTQFESDTGTSKFDLSLQFEETADRLSGWFEYNTDLFDAGRIVRMAAHFEHLLAAVVNDPARPISMLPMVTPAEQAQILSGWNNAFAQSLRDLPSNLFDLYEPVADASDFQIYLLDSHMQIVPVGLPGELYIGGWPVLQGYLNSTDLTAEKFVPNPFSSEPGQRLYKTGELWRHAPDGRLESLGSIDEQVDRKAPGASPIPSTPERLFAANTTAEILTATWAEVLEIEQPGLHDNFFEIGGHSLLAARIMSRVRNVFQVQLGLRNMFEAPTVAGLAKLIDDARRTRPGRPGFPLQPVPRDVELPLSFAQERLWFLQRLHPDVAPYNISGAVRITGRSNAVLIAQCINEIIRRHESLRTTIQTRDGRPVQVPASPAPVDLPVVDLSHLAEAERETHYERLAREEARRGFDLTTGPLFRSTLIVLGGNEKVLLVNAHHIVADGWSIKVFVKELAAIWKSFAAGLPSPLPELTIQYADFAYWHRHSLENGMLGTELEYWKKQIAEAPLVLDLPADYPRPALQTLRGGLHHFEIPETLSQRIRDLSRSEGVTLFIAFNSAFQVLLHHYTDREDLIVGTDIAERNLTELEGLIGLLVNQVVLRTRLSSVMTFRELLKQVRDTTLAAYDHQQLPFNKLVEALKPELDLSRNPLFQIMIVFQGEPLFAVHLPECSLTLAQTDAGASPFDLSLLLAEERNTIKATLRYNTDLFKASRIVRVAEHLELIVSAVVERPDIELEELRRILTESDQQRQLTKLDAVKDVRRQKFAQLKPRAAYT
ncbi:MAG TPA: amino acid adenylation domain-containing protein [Pyrinomonadaceae bacterium]|nr:amino acid adenylation domain-containing protein [Pyrinomonadaceae bacterium]